MTLRREMPLTVVLLLLAILAHAQWSDDPAVNLVVGDGPGAQVVPHLAVVPDGVEPAGHTYVGWYDNDSGNYDVLLQLLGPDGVPVFAPGGLIVSAHPQNTWVMDWSLAVDQGGNAVLAFADIRGGDSNIHIYKIGPDGSFPWGADGITLTADTDFKGPPCVTVTSDNQVVVVWMQSDTTSVLRLQRLEADGDLLLPAGGVAVSEAGDQSPAGNVLLPTLGSDVLLGYVPTYTFMANRQIKVQRFDAAGAAVWPAAVMVMDDGTVPMGHYFEMTPDGTGGVIFAWSMAVGNAFGARVQRLDADGAEALPHNGAYVDAGGATGQIGPSAVYDTEMGEITVAFGTVNANQSQRGVNAQRFDAAGDRLWGPAGTTVLPRDADLAQQLRLNWDQGVPMGVVLVNVASAYGQDIVQAFRLDDTGGHAWGGPVTLASVYSGKEDIVAASNGETLVCVWDDESGDADVVAQNVNADGTLGELVVAVGDGRPATLSAHGNYPNPFNPSTTIAFDLSRPAHVDLRVYDAGGRMVRRLASREFGAGRRQVVWDGTDDAGRRLPSGVYHYRLEMEGRVAGGTMNLVK